MTWICFRLGSQVANSWAKLKQSLVFLVFKPHGDQIVWYLKRRSTAFNLKAVWFHKYKWGCKSLLVKMAVLDVFECFLLKWRLLNFLEEFTRNTMPAWYIRLSRTEGLSRLILFCESRLWKWILFFWLL